MERVFSRHQAKHNTALREVTSPVRAGLLDFDGRRIMESTGMLRTIATSLTSWEEFLLLPEGPRGAHYQLQDGEVILAPPPSAIHVYLQITLVQWLTDAAQGQGRGVQEFPYRPAKNLQFWYADVAYVPREDLKAMRGNEYPIYSPPLLIEIFSTSNKAEEIERKRLVAFSCGTREFWLVDHNKRTIEVSSPGLPTRVYGPGDSVSVSVIADTYLPVDKIFQD